MATEDWADDTLKQPAIDEASADERAQLGHYVLLKRLAAGGMAEVFLAELQRQNGFKKTVVVKCILPQHAKDARFMAMFHREARTAVRLNHPNIVQVFELGEHEGRAFLVMECVDGLTLVEMARRHWAQSQRVPVDIIARAIADAALGLAHAHDQRLVHRDVSPDNLMITRGGVTKVVDFGIARPEDSDLMTEKGELKGKVPFMAPEYLVGDPLDYRVDIYALGVTLYYLLTATRPFFGDTTREQLEAINRGNVRPPRELNAEVPQLLSDLTLHCMARDPERRPRSARIVADVLGRIAPTDRDGVAAFVVHTLGLPPSTRAAASAPAAGTRSPPNVDDSDASLPMASAVLLSTLPSTLPATLELPPDDPPPRR